MSKGNRLADLEPGQPPLTPPLGFDRGVLVQRSHPLLGQSVRNANQATLPAVIHEIDIWRVAALMVKRYAEDAEANADRCADDLETEGDQAGAAIWRRVTVAIEQLTDTTGPRH